MTNSLFDIFYLSKITCLRKKVILPWNPKYAVYITTNKQVLISTVTVCLVITQWV